MSDQSEHITAREFDGFKDAIVQAIHDASSNVEKRFDTMERRFDTTQQTTNDLMKIAGDHESQLKGLWQRIKIDPGHRHARKDDPAPPLGDDEPLTMKDLKRALWVAIALFGIAGFTAVAFVMAFMDRKPTP